MRQMSDELKNLLRRSAVLERYLFKFMELSADDSSNRTTSSRIMCGVAFEHAQSIKLLIVSGNFTSAIGLLRLQYEALVRAMWLWYAASDAVTSRLMGEFTHENAKKADRLSMMTQMLTELEGKPPADAMQMLLQFKEHSWKPLSSYVHGGIHLLHRHSKGYPPVLILQAIKASNTVSIMISMHLAALSGDPQHVDKIPKIQAIFANCLLETRPQARPKK